MNIHERITQARHDRTARRAIRVRRATWVRELSTYSSPADRNEIQLMAGRSSHPAEAAAVLVILDRMTLDNRREDINHTA